MSYVIPSTARYRLDDGVDTLNFSIPAQKHWFYLLFGMIWLTVWAFAELMVGGMILVGVVAVITGDASLDEGAFPGLFMLVWFTLWTLGGTSVLFTLLWQLMGVETIRIGANDLMVQRRVLGIGRSKLYDAQYLRGLRVVPSESFLMRQRRNPYYVWIFNVGTLAFDYGAKTYRIGADLEEAEARDMLTTIQARFPQYG